MTEVICILLGLKTSATALEDTTVMDVSPTIMNDYTMVPLRAISEMFGATVNWDGGTSTVTIDYTKKNVEEGLAKKFESEIKKETLTENIVFNIQRNTYTEVSINGEKLMLDVEVVK